jgi:hypothetical protein
MPRRHLNPRQRSAEADSVVRQGRGANEPKRAARKIRSIIRGLRVHHRPALYRCQQTCKTGLDWIVDECGCKLPGMDSRDLTPDQARAIPRRRWPRFLLPILVALMPLCCMVGFELNWIRQRHEFLAQNEARHRREKMLSRPVLVINIRESGRPRPNDLDEMIAERKRKQTAPGLLWIFGEAGHEHVQIQVPVTSRGRPPKVRNQLDAEAQKRIADAERLFPEAAISVTIRGGGQCYGQRAVPQAPAEASRPPL